ncbi:unnamed protein product [Ascophyllum nodosum]
MFGIFLLGSLYNGLVECKRTRCFYWYWGGSEPVAPHEQIAYTIYGERFVCASQGSRATRPESMYCCIDEACLLEPGDYSRQRVPHVFVPYYEVVPICPLIGSPENKSEALLNVAVGTKGTRSSRGTFIIKVQ